MRARWPNGFSTHVAWLLRAPSCSHREVEEKICQASRNALHFQESEGRMRRTEPSYDPYWALVCAQCGQTAVGWSLT